VSFRIRNQILSVWHVVQARSPEEARIEEGLPVLLYLFFSDISRREDWMNFKDDIKEYWVQVSYLYSL
jgi:hypothetical protein